MAVELTKTIGKRAPDGAWEVPILGDIGFFGVDGAELIRELNAVKPSAVKFLIYSPGGAVYDAIAIAGFIQDKGIECYAEIYGTCMSAATVFAALAGPKRTSIAAGSMFLVHMPYGGDQKSIDNATDWLIDLYVKSYGWSKAEARKHMEAEDGNGILWTADEAKELGVVGEVMKMSIAAHFKQKHTAMAENKNTVKVTAKVKLSTMDAIRAAMGEGAEVEVEVSADEALTAELEQAKADATAANAKVTELEAKVAEHEAGAITDAQKVSDAENAAKEAVEQVTAKDEEIKNLKAQVKALDDKQPGATRTVANNQAASVAAMPGTATDPTKEFVGNVFSQMDEVQKAKHAVEVRNRKQANKA